ncbi:uncharacterized protein AC631_01450 [Debaryomyces fabryi]|uniref:Uncharacterized protein n=1 Tax=Debaryomyces fabryi TaxID=58627 RepID=A0A0V1Q340_9ASCO|nr:uncharacterized protein AC631_01450 [Debaryomyces fabryi]KSA02746.1 hypothetical protein AC631_01450 [Debaryomyces fabryi]CUM56061.1 unnamed protein product [Debaryomyces fabryi]
MAIFRSKSSKKDGYQDGEVRLSKQDFDSYKMTTNNMHDPILSAVNEAQPFEQAAEHDQRRPSYLSQESSELKDIFGNSIRQADISNPTRSRNERPLDTIRTFEYAITGDPTYRDQMETQRLGWGFHEDFTYHNMGARDTSANGAGEYERPVINFGASDNQGVYQAANYSATSLQPEAKKKKKKGLFGRKK